MSKEVVAHLPGTFYRKPSPDDPPFKSEGDSLAVGDVIGLIEVMKSFHEVKSDKDGRISAFLVENEDAVMAGQPLVTLD
ncbi:MAG: acetyl-CoA carboxylase [Alphaproteobacteria bacterium]